MRGYASAVQQCASDTRENELAMQVCESNQAMRSRPRRQDISGMLAIDERKAGEKRKTKHWREGLYLR